MRSCPAYILEISAQRKIIGNFYLFFGVNSVINKVGKDYACTAPGNGVVVFVPLGIGIVYMHGGRNKNS